MALTSVKCSECKASAEIDVSAEGKLLWECPSCEARNVYGEGVGHAAVDEADSLNFVPESAPVEGVVQVVDSEGGSGSQANG